MYLIKDSSGINTVFSIQLQNESRTNWAEKQIFVFLVKKQQRIFDQKITIFWNFSKTRL